MMMQIVLVLVVEAPVGVEDQLEAVLGALELVEVLLVEVGVLLLVEVGVLLLVEVELAEVGVVLLPVVLQIHKHIIGQK